MISIEEIQKVVTDSNSKIESGAACIFFKINNKIGLKTYNDKSVRDYAYKYQSLAAEHNLGPETYGIINDIVCLIGGFSECRYGYFTEIVEVYSQKDLDSRVEKNNFYKFHQTNIDKLREELKELTGFNFYDDHHENTGIKNDKLICIDFE